MLHKNYLWNREEWVKTVSAKYCVSTDNTVGRAKEDRNYKCEVVSGGLFEGEEGSACFYHEEKEPEKNWPSRGQDRIGMREVARWIRLCKHYGKRFNGKKKKKNKNLKGNDSRAKLTFFSSENAFKIILYIPAI